MAFEFARTDHSTIGSNLLIMVDGLPDLCELLLKRNYHEFSLDRIDEKAFQEVAINKIVITMSPGYYLTTAKKNRLSVISLERFSHSECIADAALDIILNAIRESAISRRQPSWILIVRPDGKWKIDEIVD